MSAALIISVSLFDPTLLMFQTQYNTILTQPGLMILKRASQEADLSVSGKNVLSHGTARNNKISPYHPLKQNLMRYPMACKKISGSSF
jgi:hypothetical protein